MSLPVPEIMGFGKVRKNSDFDEFSNYFQFYHLNGFYFRLRIAVFTALFNALTYVWLFFRPRTQSHLNCKRVAWILQTPGACKSLVSPRTFFPRRVLVFLHSFSTISFLLSDGFFFVSPFISSLVSSCCGYRLTAVTRSFNRALVLSCCAFSNVSIPVRHLCTLGSRVRLQIGLRAFLAKPDSYRT